MTVVQAVGLFLVAAGVVELALFRYLAQRKDNIARRKRILDANALLNLTVGVILLVVGG